MASMTKTDKYLEALKQCEGWVTAAEWALKVAELYPKILEEAEEQAKGQKNETTGMRELTARIHSNVSRGAYKGEIEVDTSERPRKFRYATKEELDRIEEEELQEEMEELTRAERIRRDFQDLNIHERYRLEEMEAIAKTFNHYFKTDLEVDHATSLFEGGRHHPDNMQIISKTHNRIKSKSSWNRMSLEKQIEYLRRLKEYHSVLFDVDDEIFESLMGRLQKVYSPVVSNH